MAKPRYYLQRNYHYPEMDLWVEMENCEGSNPKFHIFSYYKGRPYKCLTLNVSSANRLLCIVKKFNDKILDVRPDWKSGATEEPTEEKEEETDSESSPVSVIGFIAHAD